MSKRRLLLGLIAIGLAGPSSGQFVTDRVAPGAAELAELQLGVTRLARQVERLKASPSPLTELRLPDVEIYLDGVRRLIDQRLFFAAQNVTQARACLTEGTRRAEQLASGVTPWLDAGGYVVLGHRSRVDDSAQPYQAFIPAGLDRTRPAPLHIFLHGRASTLNEVSFLTSTIWSNSYFGTPEPGGLTLYPYGRGNNGWRWAGERDLWESLADLKRRVKVDPDRIILRGFSMGGHGTWHLGLQHPGEWSAMAPGAGFTDTRVYQKITAKFPDWQESLLHMYDPIDYAANAANLPVLAYCGDEDPAIGQHQQMIEAMTRSRVPFREYIGPKTPHRYEPAVRAEMLKQLSLYRRETASQRVSFTTYTLRWPRCKWVTLRGLERHWSLARVDAERTPDGITVSTSNVTALSLASPAGMPVRKVAIDGVTVQTPATSGEIELVRRNERWVIGTTAGLRKRPGLQGPIDDALFGPVLAVRPSGTAWHVGMARWLESELRRFREGWGMYHRADLPEVSDAEATNRRTRGRNLYLFGDPGSNAVLARLLPRLPVRWTRTEIIVGDQRYSPAEHLPMLVFPNPEDPEHYVVLNVGFTFSRADWEGSNARQYAHLPDWAVIRYDPERFSDERASDVVAAGFFNERWQLPGEAR